MVGNLVDNACKWAQSRVAIEVLKERSDDDRQVIRIIVDDDGRGLTPAEREQVTGAAAGSTRPSLVPALACRSWWSLPRFMAGRSRSAAPRSAGCAPNWCCRRPDPVYFDAAALVSGRNASEPATAFG